MKIIEKSNKVARIHTYGRHIGIDAETFFRKLFRSFHSDVVALHKTSSRQIINSTRLRDACSALFSSSSIRCAHFFASPVCARACVCVCVALDVFWFGTYFRTEKLKEKRNVCFTLSSFVLVMNAECVSLVMKYCRREQKQRKRLFLWNLLCDLFSLAFVRYCVCTFLFFSALYMHREYTAWNFSRSHFKLSVRKIYVWRKEKGTEAGKHTYTRAHTLNTW